MSALVGKETRTSSSTGALKGTKPEAFDLIPSGPVKLLAQWYGFSPVDFTKATGWEPVINYIIEHLNSFWIGDDNDSATGLPHLVSAAAGVAYLLETGDTLRKRADAYTPLEVNCLNNAVPVDRYDLIPPSAMFRLARHYGAGAVKYAAHNWAAGYEWSKPYAALNRHLWQTISGEYIDEETGSPHLVAVLWHCLTMTEFYTTHPEFDDRPIRGTQSTNMSELESPKTAKKK